MPNGSLSTNKDIVIFETCLLQTYFLRTITSVNQLSMYGAVSDWCEELAQRIEDRSKGTRKPVEEKQTWSNDVTHRCVNLDDHFSPMIKHRETSCVNTQQKFAKPSRWSSCDPSTHGSQIHETILRKDNISWLFTMKKWQTSDVLDYAQNTPRNEADSQVKGWIQGNARIGTALEVIATNHMEELKSKLILCKVMDPYLGYKNCQTREEDGDEHDDADTKHFSSATTGIIVVDESYYFYWPATMDINSSDERLGLW